MRTGTWCPFARTLSWTTSDGLRAEIARSIRACRSSSWLLGPLLIPLEMRRARHSRASSARFASVNLLSIKSNRPPFEGRDRSDPEPSSADVQYRPSPPVHSRCRDLSIPFPPVGLESSSRADDGLRQARRHLTEGPNRGFHR